MQKTKLGISVGLMGFITYLACYFGGYIVAILLFGYILLVENNQWLRKTAVKALILTITFSVLPAIIQLIPDAIEFIGKIVSLFGGNFHASIITGIINLLTSAMGSLINRICHPELKSLTVTIITYIIFLKSPHGNRHRNTAVQKTAILQR